MHLVLVAAAAWWMNAADLPHLRSSWFFSCPSLCIYLFQYVKGGNGSSTGRLFQVQCCTISEILAQSHWEGQEERRKDWWDEEGRRGWGGDKRKGGRRMKGRRMRKEDGRREERDVEEGLTGNGAMRGRRWRYQRRIQMTLWPWRTNAAHCVGCFFGLCTDENQREAQSAAEVLYPETWTCIFYAFWLQSEIMEYAIWSCRALRFSCRFLIPSLLSASLRQTNQNVRTAGNNPVWTLGDFSLMFQDDPRCKIGF